MGGGVAGMEGGGWGRLDVGRCNNQPEVPTIVLSLMGQGRVYAYLDNLDSLSLLLYEDYVWVSIGNHAMKAQQT